MGQLERLARLEARVRELPTEPASERNRRLGLYHEYFLAWTRELRLEDVSQDEADVEIWHEVERYGPMVLGMIWEGILPGREELLGAGVDFSRAGDCSDVVGGRVNPLPPQLLRNAT